MELANKRIDDTRTVLLGRPGELGVTRGGDRTGMAKQRLDVTKTQALFEQVRGKRMAQGVNGGFFLI